jgi:nucleoside-diphosphate-sugar epimerase/glycosyltransferase involved in cell wall biosynthesis
MDIKSHIKNLKGPIIVTGASGFVGANLFKTLIADRKDVYGLVKHEKGWRLNDIADDRIMAVDLNDSAATKNLVESIKPKTVFDCVSYGAYSFEQDPTLIYKTNFQSLVYFITQLSKYNISAYVHAGSSSEYGLNSAAPLEDAPCIPNSDYAVSKVAAAQYLHYMGKDKKFPAINLRLYSVYGPLEDSSRLIPNIVHLGLKEKFPPFVSPNTSRDFIYVDDVSSAFILAASKIHPDLYGENFNIGSGIKTTIADLANITKLTFKIRNEPVFGDMEGRAWDLSDWYSDSTKAKRLLSWQAETALQEGLIKTADWLKVFDNNEFKELTKKNNITKKRSLSAIVACYKDNEAIPVMYERLSQTFKKLKIDYEIIFVNDGSPDDSAEVIQKISEKDHRVIGITHSRNFGSQMAFRSGMELSSKQGVVLLDGDLQDPPELIEDFYKKWEEGFDVVYGRRIKRDMPWYLSILYKLFYRIFASLSYITIPLDAGDFSLIDHKVATWMLKCKERDLFMRGIRAYVGFKQTGVDYIRPERIFGRSTNNFLKNLDWAKKGIFSFSNVPLTMLTSIGLISLILSILIGFTVIILRIFNPDIAPRGFTTLILLLLIFGSLNLFAIGLLGEYIAKIMAEVKGRPRLIRSSMIRNGKATEFLPDHYSNN